MPFFMFFIIKERKRYVKFALHQIKSAINFVFSKESLTFALSLSETYFGAINNKIRKIGDNKMNIDELVKRISKTDGLSKTLGMHFISTPEPDTLQATMKVDERNRQPFGFLSGGASLALAENVAGIGSLALCPGQIAVGINVSGTHVQAVSEGDTVTAFAKIVHKGRTLHTWQVDIKNTAGEVICTVLVTNYVFTPKKDNQKKGAETKV